jgi:hypothetical protein
VLIACEFSAVVRDAFRALGHDAWSCDLLPCEGDPRFHIQGDVLQVLSDGGIDLLIAHPPCTFILNSGCKWLYKDGKRYIRNKQGQIMGENPRDPSRWAQMVAGAKFFKSLWQADIPRKALENPIMVGHALQIVGSDYTQKIQPYEFGHPESKATCLWLHNLPPLIPTNNVKAAMLALPRKERERIHFMSPGKHRSHERSRSYSGIAAAMAQQWGNL